MDKTTVPIVIYVILSLVAIGVLVLFLVKCKKKTKSNYCVCTGTNAGRGRFCKSPEEARRLYRDGLTEYSDLAAMQKSNGGPKWNTTSPGDYNWPQSYNCSWDG